MEKRFTFTCWKCTRTYTLFKEITDQQQLIVSCPYCETEGVVNLLQYRQKTKPVWRGTGDEGAVLSDAYEYLFPERIPAEKPA